MKMTVQQRADLLEIRERVTWAAGSASPDGSVALTAIAFMADVLLRASENDKATDQHSSVQRLGGERPNDVTDQHLGDPDAR